MGREGAKKTVHGQASQNPQKNYAMGGIQVDRKACKGDQLFEKAKPGKVVYA